MRYLGAFLLAFFPGVISVAVQETLRKREDEPTSKKGVFISWVCYTYLINLCLSILKSGNGWGRWLYADTLNQAANVFKYGAIAFFLAVLFAAVWNRKYLVRRSAKSGAAAALGHGGTLPPEAPAPGRRDRIMFVALSLAAAVFALLFWTRGKFAAKDFNMGTVAFSYEYGFNCRSLIGTLLQAIAKVQGKDLSTLMIERFYFLAATALVFSIVLFLYLAAARTGRLSGGAAAHDVLLLGLVFEAGVGFSTFFIDWGRTDIFLLILSLLACWLLVVQKGTPLVVLIAAVCMLIHEGYVFMYASLLFVTLAYRIVCSLEKKDSRGAVKYGLEFVVGAAVVLTLFLYFYFIARPREDLTYIQVVKNTLKVVGDPSDDLINTIYAIQGQLFGDRWTYLGSDTLAQRIHYLAPTLVMFSPFIVLFFSYWGSVWRGAKTSGHSRLHKLLYHLIPFGSITVFPLFMLHMDYWRWYYQICFYELFIVLILIACGDELLTRSLRDLFSRIARVRYLPAALVTYAVILGPFRRQSFYLYGYYITGLDTLKKLF